MDSEHYLLSVNSLPFDTMNHQILLDKLHCYGIGNGGLLFFRSYLQYRTQCCSVNGQISTLQTVTCEVPQESILGPLLFIIYLNDFPAFVQEANITMYADDTSLHKAFRTFHELKEEMIHAFFKVCKWLRNNKLSLNTVKTEFMIIGTLPRLIQLDSSPESTPYAIFVCKEVMNLHPEQADSPFQRLDCLHSYNTRSVSNNNLFIPGGGQV